MTKPTLYLTPLSHFSRKVRIVMEELGIECEYVYVPNLLSTDASDFGGNPILRVPVFKDGSEWVVESDSIVRYLLEREPSQADPFHFFGMSVAQRNGLAMISAIMGAEVELLLSKRSGVRTGEEQAYFDRYREVIRQCLLWLESQGPTIWPNSKFSYLDVALICMWDHLRYNRFVGEIRSFPWIEKQAAVHATRASVINTAPEKMEKLQWDLYPGQRPEILVK